ncbi:unnamed protein product [Rotaria sp. Silwood2]|nr:unnamed protein product [Rotaria sp. Silwood2]CAF4514858.1 unnamed protein product [Rotaria sp. Silwood2]
MSAAFQLQIQVVDNLRAYYNINETVAKDIYNETMVLYHQLSTMTNFNELNTVNKRVLFALIIVIGHYYDFTESTRFFFLSYYVYCCRKAVAQYMFIQWLSSSAQDKSIDNGLNIFIYSLKALRKHFMRNIYLKNTLNKSCFV